MEGRGEEETGEDGEEGIEGRGEVRMEGRGEEKMGEDGEEWEYSDASECRAFLILDDSLSVSGTPTPASPLTEPSKQIQTK